MPLIPEIKNHPKTGLVVLSFIAFIALGMPDGLLGIAWPSIRSDFSIPLDAAGMLLAAGVTGYLTSSFLSGPLISRWGVGNILSVSCGMTGLALIGYTAAPFWWMIVLCGLFSGLGAGAIDAGLNSYAAANFTEGLMQWLHASYGIGITLGPIIMTGLLTAYNSWRAGYNVVGSFQIALAICFILTIPVWNKKRISSGQGGEKLLTDYETPLIETLFQPGAWLSMFLFFIYTGSEVTTGTWAYTLMTESRGIQSETAGFWVGSYWASFTAGRIIAGVYAKRSGTVLLMFISLFTALAGAMLLWWNPFTFATLISVSLIGCAIGPVFPALMSATSSRVGVKHAANTIGMQMAAGSIGVAFIPTVAGMLAKRITLEIIPVFLIFLFAILLGLHLLAHRSGNNNN